MQRSIGFVTFAWLGVAMSACTVFTIPAATFEQGVEHVPGPGYFHVVGDPPAAMSDIVVRWFAQEGEESGVSSSLTAGALIEIDGVAFEGQEGLTVNGQPCDGRFSITSPT